MFDNLYLEKLKDIHVKTVSPATVLEDESPRWYQCGFHDFHSLIHCMWESSYLARMTAKEVQEVVRTYPTALS